MNFVAEPHLASLKQFQRRTVAHVAKRLFDELTSIQYGKRDDPFGWVVPV